MVGRTIVRVWARGTTTTHHGHGLATSAASLGRKSRAKWLSALGEVLGGTIDLCRGMLAWFHICEFQHCNNIVVAPAPTLLLTTFESQW